MKQGSIVKLDYTGTVIATKEVFESTIEKKAVEAGIFSQKQKYEPMTVIVGEGDVLKGLDKALIEMKAGETKELDLKPEEAWGERKPQNIAVIPLQQFKKEKMQPFPGLVVEVNGRQGKVQSVSGGRVRVDFNHPLAGKDLHYELKIVKEITEPKEQIDALYSKYFYMVAEQEKSIKVSPKEVEVTLSPRWSANLGPLKQAFSRIITKHVKGYEKVRFVEEFKQEKKQAEPEDKQAEEKKDNEPKEPAEKKEGPKAKDAAAKQKK